MKPPIRQLELKNVLKDNNEMMLFLISREDYNTLVQSEALSIINAHYEGQGHGKAYMYESPSSNDAEKYYLQQLKEIETD